MPRLALLLTTFIWGATFPATKAVLEQIPPFSFLFLRFLLGALLVGGGYLLLRFHLHRDPALLRASAIATGWLILGYVFQTIGLNYTTASNSAFTSPRMCGEKMTARAAKKAAAAAAPAEAAAEA